MAKVRENRNFKNVYLGALIALRFLIFNIVCIFKLLKNEADI